MQAVLGNPYIMKYTDDFGNLCTQEVEHPEVLSDFFEMTNTVDHHNQTQQSDLALKKAWIIKDCYFQLASTIIGINILDCWKLADHHKIIKFKTQTEGTR